MSNIALSPVSKTSTFVTTVIFLCTDAAFIFIMETTTSLSPAELASRFINHSNRNIFLTGKAGTGKTTFLRRIIQSTHKKAVIVAPTGIAAINAGGVTIHSLFQLPFGSFVPVELNTGNFSQQFKINTPASISRNFQMGGFKRKMLKELELLVIDEVSMLRADLLDAIDARLKFIRNRKNLPFGGVQVLFIGDLLQLPPVVKNEEWEILRPYYKSAFFFDAQVLQSEKPLYIELDKIYRQSDDRFISLLNNLRKNSVSEQDIALLNNFYRPDFKIDTKENYIYLTTHNYKANELNAGLLAGIKSPSRFFEAKIKGEFSEYAFPVEKKIELKKGAQVMFVKNDASGMQLYFNGKIGIVSGFSEDEDGEEIVLVKCEGNEKLIAVGRNEWQNIKYALNSSTNEIEEQVEGTFSQFPLKLAWAITIHKSQGLTFEKAIIDIGSAFAPGQVYVALSRLKSLDGLILTSKINYSTMRSDEHVSAYAKTKEDQENLSLLAEKESAEFLKGYLYASFDAGGLYKLFTDHWGSCDPNEKKSLKWKNRDWITTPIEEIEKIKPHTEKFLSQVRWILETREGNYMEFLNERLIAAENYFYPVLKSISETTLKHIEKINREKRAKEYLEELMELDSAVYEKQKQMKKAIVLARTLMSKKEFTKEEVKEIINDTAREERVKAALSKTASPEKKGKRKTIEVQAEAIEENEYIHKANSSGRSEKKTKIKSARSETEAHVMEIISAIITDFPVKKLSSKELSFYLFKAGKNLEEIAAIRKIAITTVSSHLVSYVANGLIDATEIISKEKLEIIIEESKKHPLQNLTSLKESLGTSYSWEEIRFAFAWRSFMETPAG